MRTGLFLLLVVWSGSAQAYVREKTEKGVPVHWGSACAALTPDSSAPYGISREVAQTAVDKAIAHWQSVTTEASPPCSFLHLSALPAEATEARFDHENVIKVRKDQWCRPAEGTTPQLCFSQDAASITTSFYVADTGEILDSDIELNDINFTFFDEPRSTSPRVGTKAVDLEATLTHELGHLQGLDHTCWDHSSSTQPTDADGKLVPDCNALAGLPTDQYERITTSAMFPFPPAESTSQRTPKADDIAGICAIYPAAADPGKCLTTPAAKGCCSTANAPSLMLALFALSPLRRRRRA